MTAKIRVLIVDDSALARRVLSDVISSSEDFEVMGAVRDPFEAAEFLRHELPHVVVLDVEMPRMDGLTFLRKMMAQFPIPTVICSTLATEGSATALTALECGAVDIVTKPTLGLSGYLNESSEQLLAILRGAARARVRKLVPRYRAANAAPKGTASPVVAPKLTADAVLAPRAPNRAMLKTTDTVVAIGASTGGTEALREVFQGLPIDCPPIVVVQHMPERFTQLFAQRLDGICAPHVLEATHGASVLPGQILIAPGNRHMLLERCGARYYVELNDGPPVTRHRPSVDVLFRSVAQVAGRNAAGFLLTGMGDDGAHGLLEMRTSGAHTYAQDEESCIVYGMPGEAVKLGAAERSVPLSLVARTILEVTSH